jgi:ABC-type bacteriocin/lantibiotic exporter with double-glycine peptidase domain
MKNKMSPLKRFFKLLQPDKKDIYQVILYAIFSGLVSLSLPLGIQAIINLIQGGRVSLSWIILVIVVVVGVILSGILRLMQMRITENIQQKIFTRSSFEFGYRFPKIKFDAIYNQYAPELANRFFDTMSIQKGVANLILEYSAAFLQIVFSLILLSLYHPFFIVFGFMLFLLLYLIFRYSFDAGLESSLKESKYKYKVAHWLQEIARNQITFKNESHHHYALEKNNSLVEGYLEHRENHFKVLVRQFTQLIGFKTIITASLLLIGGFLVINQQMNIGQFVAAEIVIIGVISSVEKIIAGLETLYDVLTSIEKVGQVVDLELEQDFNRKVEVDTNHDIILELDDISYTFPDEKSPILKNININIQQGELIYLDGRNGSGKSTLLKIISGLLEPASSFFFVNDENFRKVKWSEYRSNIGVITTGQTTFEGTMFENITFKDKNISNEKIKWVIEKTKLFDYLKAHPLGLDAPVFTDGKQIPSSIMQKIVLARTIIHEPKLLILEDPTDRMDDDQAKEIIDFITNPENKWTVIVVAKNPYWKEKCSRIITLDKGQVVSDIKIK